MKKVLMIVGGIVLAVVVIIVAIILINSAMSDKLVCKSTEGNITITYNEDGLTGYTTVGSITYDYDNQSAYASKIGVDSYMSEFTEWFEENTDGTCVIK